MRLDLHIHSTASDGSCGPADVVGRAVKGGLDVIALADHDTVGGVAEATEAAEGKPVEVIPALELSSTHGEWDVHVLGYFVDPEASSIRDHQLRSRGRREERMRTMLDRLLLQGVRLRYRDVVAQLGDADVAPARPHLARALVAAGYAASVPDAFARLIGDKSPAFEPTGIADPAEVIRTVTRAGGIAVWAHPDPGHLPILLDSMVEAGLGGLEVHRPRNPQKLVDHLEKVARERSLVVTGGSDWHGPEGGRALGDFHVTGEEVADFLEAGGL